MPALIQSFLDPASKTYTYVVYEHDGGHCAVIDPVLDYDPTSGRSGTEQADRVIAFVREHQLTVQWLLETHAHADHLSAAPYLRRELGGKIAIGQFIKQVQRVFKALFNLEPQFSADGSQFDHLFAPDESFFIGDLKATALHVPGHTPADMAYLIDSDVMSTVGEQRRHNIHVHDGIDEATFVAMRTRRDSTLDMPTLLLPAVQVNVRAGNLPPAEDNGVTYLKIPINRL
jgi:glyoxylase-like metal-dependent hydrolase (beta-lactamase superfamily II)